MDDKKTNAGGESTPGKTNAQEIAARMAQENRDAVPGGPTTNMTLTPGTETTVVVETFGDIDAPLVDIYGRPFDPVLHLTKMDGSTPALRKGLLICKKGQGLGVPRAPKASAPAAAGGPSASDQQRLALEALGGGAPGPDAGAPGAGDAPTQAAGPAAMPPEEFARKALTRSRTARKIMGKFGRWFGGDVGDFKELDGVHEGQDIEDATLEVQTEYQKLLPVGSILVAVVAYSSYMLRVVAEKRRKKLEALKIKAEGGAPEPAPQARRPAATSGGENPSPDPDLGEVSAEARAAF